MEWIKNKPVDNAFWVKCIAEIRDNTTGEVREYETDEILREGESHPCVFNWEENNFSCDCNRLLFFNQAIGKDTEDSELKCGYERFSVNLRNAKDGKVYYREFGDNNKQL